MHVKKPKTRIIAAFLLLPLLLIGCQKAPRMQGHEFDLLIVGGEVFVDGESDPIVADIGVLNDRIAAIGKLQGARARRVLDARGMTVAPGFIDTHTHADSGGTQEAYLRQGVTTLVMGNCGGSRGIGSLTEYLDGLEADGLGPNVVPLVGHNSLRDAVGLSGPDPTHEEMEAMKALLDEAMRDGAFGLSTGLTYATGFNASTEEVIELAQVASQHGGLYASHIRGEDHRVLDAVAEAVRIGREADSRVQISHVKCMGPAVWGQVQPYLDLVEAGRREGVEILMDQYPYTAGSTRVSALIPGWAHTQWETAKTERLDELKRGIHTLIHEQRGGPDRVFIVGGDYRHMFLDEAAEKQGVTPEEIVIEIGLGADTRAIYYHMQEEDVRRFMASPLVMVGSDGPHNDHPRGHGTYPRFWGHYLRELGMFSMKEGISKTSTMAAHQFGLDRLGRGRLKEGYYADIVVFDAERIIDQATFQEPMLPPEGIEWVLINGVVAIEHGTYTGVHTGRALRHTARTGSPADGLR